jgi:hypothetical protein
MEFVEMSLLDKAMNLAYFELLGNAEELNHETQKYMVVTAQEIQEQAQQIFRKENASILSYLAKN